jgi:NAD+ synthase
MFTLWGDHASCIEPIIELYKTEIFDLARELNLPEFIFKKAPSARLWDGHNDEREFGFSYAEGDSILYYLVEENLKREHFNTIGIFDEKTVEKVMARVEKNIFKQNIPITCLKSYITKCIV